MMCLRLQASCALCLTTALALGCAGSQSHHESVRDPYDPGAVRYRLLLRENPVDPGEAFRCYGDCQSEPSPQGYLDCVMRCPGADTTAGVHCAQTDVPPVAECFTVRKVKVEKGAPVAYLVLEVLGDYLLIVALDALCAYSTSRCQDYGRPY